MSAHKAQHLITGESAEQLAKQYLLGQGLEFITQNFRCKQGEIDLIMQHNCSIIFIEVRYRKQIRFGSGAESVNHTKQKKLIATALSYLQQNPVQANQPARFDVVSITSRSTTTGTQPDIDWIQDAFQA